MNLSDRPVTLVIALAVVVVSSAARAADKQPADPLDGPPFVTCKAWAVGDGKTGAVLWGGEADKARKAASTTKMMCAYVVLQLAAKDPKVLDETVTFSKLADNTTGSTADIRAGESLTVRECLYGLLLPSGNDAGVALAEHFNARLAPPDPKPEGFKENTRSNFVAEMNRAAKQLGMADTTYRSPYGDGGTEKDATISPRDLVKLAAAAMRDPAFRKYVGTARHETDVKQPDGSPRHVVWENTNQLLKTEGYDGVKTGTTTQAGACLVSSGRRGDDHLIVVVLGSTSGDARFTDSRNLFRWAWRERAKR